MDLGTDSDLEDGEGAQEQEKRVEEPEVRGLEEWRRKKVEEELAAAAAARRARGVPSDEEEEEADVMEPPQEVVEVEDDEIEEVGGVDPVVPQPQDADQLEVPAVGDAPTVEVNDIDSTYYHPTPYRGGDTNTDTDFGITKEQLDAYISYMEANPGASMSSFWLRNRVRPPSPDAASPKSEPDSDSDSDIEERPTRFTADDSFGVLPNTPLPGAASGFGSSSRTLDDDSFGVLPNTPLPGAASGSDTPLPGAASDFDSGAAETDAPPLTEAEIEEFLRIYSEAKNEEDARAAAADNTPAFFEGSGEGEGEGLGAELSMEDMIDVGAAADLVDKDQRDDSIASSREGSVHREEQVVYIVEEDEIHQPEEEDVGQDEADEFLEGETLFLTSDQAYEVEEAQTEGRLTQVCFFFQRLPTSS